MLKEGFGDKNSGERCIGTIKINIPGSRENNTKPQWETALDLKTWYSEV